MIDELEESVVRTGREEVRVNIFNWIGEGDERGNGGNSSSGGVG